jgi:ABC-2 type transport system permease protein
VTALALAAAFIRRDWRIDISYRAPFAVQLVSSVLALAVFFYLSQIVDSSELSQGQQLSGGYFGYVVMGMALLQIAQAGLTSLSQRLREEQTTGTFEVLMATPASPSLIILSTAGYEFLRATATGLGFLLVAIVLFGLNIDTDPIALAAAAGALAGCVALFASVGVAVAALTVVFKRTNSMLGFVLTCLALLGGVYFPIEVLPEPIESIAKILPFTWGLDVVRAALLGGDVDPVQLIGLWGSVLLLFPVALWTFRVALVRARQGGTLAQY